ncbi:hypothetical protein HF1_13500 [Mycoplasma haemofelis str. Langford 1]|uniref:Uncharacterized protein n=1 Tax=Mycoplasma haemofelis (strain Langford 1) TaxID=941640 RepID=E8ZJN7_MYCHL|nr:hypothetical protein [Mycoplasma haemofelis]CBY93358.1 hypothetical protein HF1_13500 [Mycoplasma haemofelis str. Langford 1]
MNGLATKAACGTAACGGVVGGSFLIKNSLNSEDKSLAAKLKDQKYKLLAFDNTHNNHWTSIASAYKEQTTSKADLKIQGITISGTTESDLTALKGACKSIVEADFSKANHDLAIKWCVIPETVSERISKDGKKVLKLDSTDSNEKSSWTSLVTKHKEVQGTDKKFSDLTLNTATDDNEISKLREKCKGIKDKKNYETDYDSSYQKFSDFCSVTI